jgi:peptide chain release factor 3
LCDAPVLTFVNKPDREGRDPFDLLDEIERSLALDVTPASWPIGMGRDFLGTYDLSSRRRPADQVGSAGHRAIDYNQTGKFCC